jgi:hypothetical protein
MKFQISLKYIRFVQEDILKLYARFEYNIFERNDTENMELRYSVKKLLNYAAIEKINKVDGRNQYKLDKYVVDKCQKFVDKHL